jgi:hypothetical protein
LEPRDNHRELPPLLQDSERTRFPQNTSERVTLQEELKKDSNYEDLFKAVDKFTSVLKYDQLPEEHPILQGLIFTLFPDSSFMTDAFDRKSSGADSTKFLENYNKMVAPLTLLP